MKQKKKVLIIAGIHGDEINGVKAAERIEKRVNEFEKSRAEIEIISPANRRAFEKLSRNNPEDNLNLNRCFPGKAEGSNSEKLAYEIFKKLANCSFAIDLHSGSKGILQYPHARLRGMRMLEDVKQRIIQLASFSGLKFILLERGIKGNLQYEAAKQGVAVITLEAGEGGRASEKYARILEEAAINIIRKATELNQSRIIEKKEVKLIRRVKIKARQSGKLKILAKVGENVKEGKAIAVLNGKEIAAGRDGFILSISTKSKINKNDIIAGIAYEAC